jgi:hypothetical protein
MLAFPDTRVGDAVSHEALTIFPLFAEAQEEVDYLLSHQALTEGVVTVEEVSEAGSVPNLLVHNQAESLVLFLEGEELRGAKQNRVLNTSVLVAARSKTTIPVSCVERGRWRYQSHYFGSAGAYASSKLRYVLRKSVAQSAMHGQGHAADQGEVWKEVRRQMEATGAHSPSEAMADTYGAHRGLLAEFHDRLKYVDGATGLAVGIGKKIVSVDLFDKPSTCREVWSRLMTGVIMDAVEAGTASEGPGGADVQQLLHLLRDACWQKITAVGAGEEHRFDTGDDKHASALVFKNTVLHGSLISVK